MSTSLKKPVGSSSVPAVSGATNTYVVELSRWGISNNGTNPVATTKGINNALAYAYDAKFTYVKLPAGTYLISKGSDPTIENGQTIWDLSENANIRPQSDTTLDLYGCIIQKETNGWEASHAIQINRKNNVTILGGKIVGDNATHDFATYGGIHEGVTGIIVKNGSKNVTLENIEITSFAGYSTSLTGEYSQIGVTTYANWEAGELDGTGLPKVNPNRMRMNIFIQLSALATIPISSGAVGVHDNTSTNGGYFVIWGNGYGTHGTRYDGNPVSLSKAVFEVHCYTAAGAYKGFVRRRATDPIYLDTLPVGTTQFKLVVRYDITKVIPSTFTFQFNAFTFSSAITMRNCKIHDSFSLAIAVTGAQQILIENCEFYKIGNAKTIIGRTLYGFPMAIDIEDGGNINQHMVIRNNIFRDNESQHINAIHVRNIVIENNKFDPPTNGLGGGVTFQGSRGAGLLSRNNYYNCAIGNGMGNCIFQNDTFVDGQIQMQFDATYDGCLFENESFILGVNATALWSAIAQTVGTSVVPVDKTSTAWVNNPLYYVVSTAGAGIWVAARKYVVNDLVIVIAKSGTTIISNRVYKCTIAPTTVTANEPTGTGTTAYADGYTWQFVADNTEPVWKTDGTATTDNAGNVWSSFSYYGDTKDYDIVKFKDCKFNFNKLESASCFLTRRGSIEYDNCKFSLARDGGYFLDGSDSATGSWDYPGKTSFKFTFCEFDNTTTLGTVRGNKVSFINTIFNGTAAGHGAGTAIANELIVSGCTFNNFDLTLKGIPNQFSINAITYPIATSKPIKSLYVINNILYLKKTVRVTGLANEGLFIQNFDNVFIEDNKAFMADSTANVRALTIYAEKYLKMTGNYFESANANNKLELFGALRDTKYTNPIPGLTAVIDKNYAKLYTILQDPTYTAQLTTPIGDGITAIT